MATILSWGFCILSFLLLSYITYKVYIRETYLSGKKFLWSKNDLANNKLKGFHYYQKTISMVIIIICTTYENVQFSLKQRFGFRLDIFLIALLIVYIGICYVKERRLAKNYI